MKHYFLLNQGDFFVHFMDLAESELNRQSKDVSINRLNAFLELALRTAISDSDPYKDHLSCTILPYTLLQQLMAVVQVTEKVVKVNDPGNDPKGSDKLLGLETFSFDYKIDWPLSLVIGRQTITKYQLIFRHLLFCKRIERQLLQAWAHHQNTKQLELGTSLLSCFLLRQRMLHFLQNFEYYMMFEVLESNWHVMEQNLQQVNFLKIFF